MAALDHWHPLAESGDLRPGKPLARVLCGQELVLFRAQSGAVGALADRCPHRGMRLSLGAVEGERLVCPYHAWAFGADGEGVSPGTPRVKVCADAFDAAEAEGLVWVKRAGSPARLPVFDWRGFRPAGALFHRIKAPMEVLLDNFTEVEHTPMVHALLGYDRARLAEIEVEARLTDDSVRIINKGAQRPLPFLVRLLFGIRARDTFIDDWTTYFSPVYTVYDQSWVAPDGETVREAVRIFVFFNPINDDETELVTVVGAREVGFAPYRAVMGAALMRLVDMEVRRDQLMVESLADKNPSLEGRRLGRFDRALRENRKRIERIYRGSDGAPAETREEVASEEPR